MRTITRRLLAVGHCGDVIMGTISSQITSPTIVYSTDYSDADQRKHESSASLAFVRGIHRGPVNSPHKGPVTRKMFPFDNVIMISSLQAGTSLAHCRRCHHVWDKCHWQHYRHRLVKFQVASGSSLVNTGSGNGLLHDGSKQWHEPILTHCLLDSKEQISKKF